MEIGVAAILFEAIEGAAILQVAANFETISGWETRLGLAIGDLIGDDMSIPCINNWLKVSDQNWYMMRKVRVSTSLE